jgi:hypothetical protein
MLSLLDKLGPHAAAVYPVGIATDEGMRKYVAEAYEKVCADLVVKEIKEERQRQVYAIVHDIGRLQHSGVQLRFASECIENPDEILAKIYADIEDTLGGDLLSLNYGRPFNEKTAEQWQLAIENAHAHGMRGAACEWLDRRFRNSVEVEPYNKHVDFLKGGRNSIGNVFVDDYYHKVAGGASDVHTREVFGGGTLSLNDREHYSAIQAESCRNEAVLFVIATDYFAKKNMRHDLMLRRTLAVVEKVGGLDQLDKIAIARFGLTSELWNEMKVFIAGADVNPHQDAGYRNAVAKDAGPTAGSIASKGPTG